MSDDGREPLTEAELKRWQQYWGPTGAIGALESVMALRLIDEVRRLWLQEDALVECIGKLAAEEAKPERVGEERRSHVQDIGGGVRAVLTVTPEGILVRREGGLASTLVLWEAVAIRLSGQLPPAWAK